jgi:hypothetical protein
MALRVAPCPRCKSALVFGERQCRSCGQTFQYGMPEPPIPSPGQIVEALSAAGIAPPPEVVALAEARANGAPRPSMRPSMPVGPPGARPSMRPASPVSAAATPAARPAPAPASAQPPGPGPAPAIVGRPLLDGPTLEGLDTGRFADPGAVEGQDIPGFVDSSLFRGLTPARVAPQPVPDLDVGRFGDVGEVLPTSTPDLEQTARDDVGEVYVQRVSGVFGSDVYGRSGEVTTRLIDDFEPTFAAPAKAPSPASSTASTAAPRAGKGGADSELRLVVCKCTERHRLPRCPACGTAHPDRA